jgi:uncharacterized protein (DUF362 family)
MAGAAGYLFHDPEGPPLLAAEESWTLPDFSLAAMAGKMAVVRGGDRAGTLDLAIKALGGMDRFIRQGEVVLIKVNAAFAASPLLGATTHPDLLAAMVRLCYQAGAARVRVTDNPINDPASCFMLTGIEAAAKTSGAELILPREEFFSRVTLDKGRLIRDWPVLKTPFQGVTRLISMAPVKDHHRSGASMILKNAYGLLGGRRNIFHQEIHSIITELALLVRPSLVVLDGTQTMVSNGPTGGSLSDLKPTHTLIAGTDPVAVDSFGATLLGITARDLPHLARAEAAGVGTTDYRSLNPAMVTL